MLKHENFVYWLQGFFEISGATSLTEAQVKVVREHLEMCFEKVKTPVSSVSTSSYTQKSVLECLKDTQTLIC